MTPTPPGRPLERLTEGADRGWYRYVGTDAQGSTYTVELDGGIRRVLSARQVLPWTHAVQTHREHGDCEPRPAGDTAMAAVRRVLSAPSLSDALRLQLLEAMASHEPPMTYEALAPLVQRTRKTIAGALTFGGWLSLDLAEAIMAACGRRFVVTSEPLAATAERVAPLTQAPHTRTGLTRVHALAIADERNWLRYIGPDDPTKARRARTFEVQLPDGATVAMPASDVIDWVQGAADSRGPEHAAYVALPERIR